MRPIIRLKEVTLNYGGHDVIKDVSVDIPSGETVIILGPSGVGKSTILKAILGILKPVKGEVYVHGEPVSTLSERDLVHVRTRMSMIFQHGALFDSMTVGQNVSFRMRELGLASDEEIDKRVSEVLRFVGLQGASKLYPAQLSGGMKKRVAIARGLAPDPELFLFDEPTVGLDPINHYNVEQLIFKLKLKAEATIIVVTHDIESAIRLADKILMLHEGKFIFNGTPNELKKSKDSRIQAFLDPASALPSQTKESK